MFKKKNCKRCGKKIKDSFEFCPSCGFHTNPKDWGMLGKDDFIENEKEDFLFGGLNGSFLNKMLGSTLKMLEKELNKEFDKQKPEPRFATKPQIRLMINGKEITPRIQSTVAQKSPIKTLPINFSNENLKKFQRLEKKEPKTQVRRVGDKVTYELEIPGVESINDISIIKLESGIEVKAIGKNKAYLKNISIPLPLTKYLLSKGRLILELDTKE